MCLTAICYGQKAMGSHTMAVCQVAALAAKEVAMTGDFVGGLLRWIGQSWFRKDDEFARRHGWRIQHGRFGLSRTYHHPGFDSLGRCPDCQGRGVRGDVGCERCSRTGRVTLDQPSPGQEARR
jgi:hypothetical protein